MKVNVKNERTKRSYFRWLREAKGYSESTVVAHERSLSRWEESTDFEDFRRFTSNKAIGFKKYLEASPGKDKALSARTRYHCIQHLRCFFQWLSTQPGFKSKITSEAISFLTLDQKTIRCVSSPGFKKFPSLEYVKQLAGSIRVCTDIDMRDQALIAFLLLSGMRDKAVATLPLGCFEKDTLEIRQQPAEGVDTKFGKSFVSFLVAFDSDLVGYVTSWVDYLRTQRLFGNTDPMFPRSKVVQAPDGYTFQSVEVEPVSWRGTGSIRTILKERAEGAGLPYYHPHSFRHANVHLALKYCRDAEQMKALSQNLGHEHIGTTLTTYGRLEQHRVGEIIRGMDFGDSSSGGLSDTEIEAIEKLLRRHRNKS